MSPRSPFLQTLACLSVVGAALAPCAATADPQPPATISYPTPVRFIPAAGRVDIVPDSVRHLLYISSGDSVLRYDWVDGTFLTPYKLGGSLKGMDLSPDGNTLLVADESYSGSNAYPPHGNVWVDVVNLADGAAHKALFPCASGEDGTFSVAYGADGRALVSSSYYGSGWVPLRLLDPVTGAVSTVATITQNSMLSASADGSVIGIAESNISDGRFAGYRVADGAYTEKTGYTDGTSWFNYEIGVNRDGTQFALPTYGGTFICDANLTKTGTVIGVYAGLQPVGVAYSPIDDIVYFPFVTTPEIRAYDTNTWTQIAAYDFGDTFTQFNNEAFVDGRTKLTRDGSMLFSTVTDGIGYAALYAPLTAVPQSVVTPDNVPVAVTLAGSFGHAGTLAYQVVTGPRHGTLTGTAPRLAYTPTRGYEGSDGFTFRALYGAISSAPAAVAISVGIPPVTKSLLTGAAGQGGFYRGPVTVTLKATDPDTAPGLVKTYYRLDGAVQQPYTVPFVVSANGPHTVVFHSADTTGSVEAPAKSVTFSIDGTRPVTDSSLSGTPGTYGYYRSAVTVRLLPADTYSGVQHCYYAVDGGPQTLYTGLFAVSGDRLHTVTFHSEDKAGNVESLKSVSFKSDQKPPVTTATAVKTTAGSRVTLAAADDYSGVAALFYSIDGKAQQTYSAPVTVTGKGVHKVTYHSVDRAGNVEATKSLSLSI